DIGDAGRQPSIHGECGAAAVDHLVDEQRQRHGRALPAVLFGRAEQLPAAIVELLPRLLVARRCIDLAVLEPTAQAIADRIDRAQNLRRKFVHLSEHGAYGVFVPRRKRRLAQQFGVTELLEQHELQLAELGPIAIHALNVLGRKFCQRHDLILSSANSGTASLRHAWRMRSDSDCERTARAIASPPAASAMVASARSAADSPGPGGVFSSNATTSASMCFSKICLVELGARAISESSGGSASPVGISSRCERERYRRTTSRSQSKPSRFSRPAMRRVRCST